MKKRKQLRKSTPVQLNDILKKPSKSRSYRMNSTPRLVHSELTWKTIEDLIISHLYSIGYARGRQEEITELKFGSNFFTAKDNEHVRIEFLVSKEQSDAQLREREQVGEHSRSSEEKGSSQQSESPCSEEGSRT